MSAPAPKVLWEPHSNICATFVELLEMGAFVDR
jgi:hypothetical protein